MTPRSLLASLLLLGGMCVPPAPLHAAPEDRKSLTVRGRALDRDGWPIERARISLHGSRSASATSDAAGRFTLGVSLGALRDLARGPIELVVEARARDENLVLADGNRELRITVRPLGEPDAEARAEVRSSLADAAAAVAKALGQSGDAAAVIEVNFARPPAGAAVPARAELTAREEAPLAGMIVRGSKPEPPEKVEPAAKIEKVEKAPKTAKAVPDTAGAAARALAAEQKATREQLARDQAAREREARENAILERESRWKAAREKAALEKQARDREASERRTREAGERQSGESAAKPSTGASGAARAHAIFGRPEPAAPALRESTAAPAPATPAPAVAAPPPASTPPSTTPEVATPSGATGSPGAAEPASSSAPPRPEASSSSTPARTETPRRSGAPARTATPAPSRTEALAPASPPAAEPCGCRIEGTVEVQSDRPLTHRLRLVVRLRGQPACRDTVELFMGSPRVFELHGATCGSHLVEVEIPEREPFRHANPERERTVGCARRSLRQLRLILLPR
jgi:hypothetical protein